MSANRASGELFIHSAPLSHSTIQSHTTHTKPEYKDVGVGLGLVATNTKYERMTCWNRISFSNPYLEDI